MVRFPFVIARCQIAGRSRYRWPHFSLSASISRVWLIVGLTDRPTDRPTGCPLSRLPARRSVRPQPASLPDYYPSDDLSASRSARLSTAASTGTGRFPISMRKFYLPVDHRTRLSVCRRASDCRLGLKRLNISIIILSVQRRRRFFLYAYLWRKLLRMAETNCSKTVVSSWSVRVGTWKCWSMSFTDWMWSVIAPGLVLKMIPDVLVTNSTHTHTHTHTYTHTQTSFAYIHTHAYITPNVSTSAGIRHVHHAYEK